MISGAVVLSIKLKFSLQLVASLLSKGLQGMGRRPIILKISKKCRLADLLQNGTLSFIIP